MANPGDAPEPNKPPSDFGDQIATWRAERGLTVDELAERAGVTTTTVEQIEESDHAVGIFDIYHVAGALGLKSATLDFGFDRDGVTAGQVFTNVVFEDEGGGR